MAARADEAADDGGESTGPVRERVLLPAALGRRTGCEAPAELSDDRSLAARRHATKNAALLWRMTMMMGASSR